LAWFCLVTALCCLAASHLPLKSPEPTGERTSVLGMAVAFAVILGPMLAVDHPSEGQRLIFRLIVPLAAMVIAGILAKPALDMILSPRDVVVGELITLFHIFFGCLFCSMVFSAFKVNVDFLGFADPGPEQGDNTEEENRK
jgi:hypothetical protein